MKQTALMLVLLALGTVGPIALGPFIGVAVYYLFAVLRPQYLWEWALPAKFGWSFYVGIATVATTVLYLPRSVRGKTFTPAHAAMLGFALWVTLSDMFAINSEVSSQWYWEYLKIFIMFFCASLAIREFPQVRTLYLIALFSLGYIAYEMNMLYLIDKRMDIYFDGFGGLDNNGAGLMIAMGVPMAYFLWQAYNRWWRWLFLAMVPVMLHAVLLSFSRGAMVALLLTCPVLIFRSVHKKGMILFAVGILLLLPILAGPEVRTRFFSVEEYEKDRSAQSRLESWGAAWRMAKDYPVVGVGVRNADLLSYKYGADVYGRAIHSQYLQILADSGFPALAFYLLLLLGGWRALGRTRKLCRESTSENDSVAYHIASGIEGAMAVFCIGAAFLSLEVFELPYLLILLALKLPLTVSQEQPVVTSPIAVPAFARGMTSFTKA